MQAERGKRLIVFSLFSYNEKKNVRNQETMQELSDRRKKRCDRIKAAIMLEGALLLVVGMIFFDHTGLWKKETVETTSEGVIKWVDFKVSYEALCKAYEYDVETYGTEVHLDWIELLAYVEAKSGGEFGVNAVSDMKEIAEKLEKKETTMEEAVKGLEYYPYYHEAYQAVLGGFVGEYEIQEKEGGNYVKKYGLKAFSPIAKGFPYSDYDDFGVSRSYGYRRQHLGHDMMGQVGTPSCIINDIIFCHCYT